jgi:hypothetical protein
MNGEMIDNTPVDTGALLRRAIAITGISTDKFRVYANVPTYSFQVNVATTFGSEWLTYLSASEIKLDLKRREIMRLFMKVKRETDPVENIEQ